MFRNWGARVEHCLRRLLDQVLQLILGWLQPWFLRKWRFLSVILPDPSTLIRYWQFGRTVMIFPVVVHQRFSGLSIATVSPVTSLGWAKVVVISVEPFYHFGIVVVRDFFVVLCHAIHPRTLSKKHTHLVWNENLEKAFQESKQIMVGLVKEGH